jgi:hypothetical protein
VNTGGDEPLSVQTLTEHGSSREGPLWVWSDPPGRYGRVIQADPNPIPETSLILLYEAAYTGKDGKKHEVLVKADGTETKD